ncbi:MAG: hypothetical protein LBI06_01665 [Treponema sp.]|jgi:hypothetical protein|nr:hypothetical protein [Treponema sp.]
MSKQLSLLPLMHQFDKDGYMADTTYWENGFCEGNDYYLVFNTKIYSLLLPENNFDWLVEMVDAETVVITKGSYNGKKDFLQITFQDNIETPYSIILSDEQVSCITPLKEGWGGKFYIYTGGLYDCRNSFDNVFYRVADTLPCDKPVEEVGSSQ